MTHPAYLYDPDGYGIEVVHDVPSEVWKGDVDAALNYFEFLDPDDLDDSIDDQRFGEGVPEPVAIPERINARQPA